MSRLEKKVCLQLLKNTFKTTFNMLTDLENQEDSGLKITIPCSGLNAPTISIRIGALKTFFFYIKHLNQNLK